MTTAKSIPDGYHSLTPYLAVDGAERAIAFYERAFGAVLTGRYDGPDGTIMHATMRVGDSVLELGDPMPDYGLVAPRGGGVSSSLMFYCDDVDAVHAGAVEAGATVVAEVTDFPSGDRYGTVLDPFGHRWSIATRVKDVPPDEVEQALKDWSPAQD